LLECALECVQSSQKLSRNLSTSEVILRCCIRLVERRASDHPRALLVPVDDLQKRCQCIPVLAFLLAFFRTLVGFGAFPALLAVLIAWLVTAAYSMGKGKRRSMPFLRKRHVHRLSRVALTVPPVEHLLWRLRKDEKVAEARIREMAHGHELRISVDSQLVWSKLFPLDAIGEAPRLSIANRALFEHRGWVEWTCG